ncbi:MAG: hypothetical protein HY904_10110 [Deltaproteobacteria bacterium]|nr:hypothetical protein [Deltaproteobacteria bacterium]
MARFIRVRATFLDDVTGAPLHGAHYHARLYDQDVLRDDFLGDAPLSPRGTVEVLFASSSVRSRDSPSETQPDLYLVLYEGTHVRFRTTVQVDVDLPEPNPGVSEGAARLDLGVFRVR